MITIGHYDYLQDAYGLTIPQGLDEVLESTILDYYIQEITYYYAENYLDIRAVEYVKESDRKAILIVLHIIY